MREKIHGSQLFVLALLYTLGTAILFIPHLVIKHAQQDAWIASFLALFIGIIIVTIYVKINNMFPEDNFVQMLEKTFGKTIGKIIGTIVLIGFLLNLTVMTLRDFGDFIVMHILPETPLLIVVILFSIVIAFAVKKGVEVIARAAQLLVPIAVFFYLLSAVLLLKNSDFSNLLPVFSNGWKPIIRASIPHIGYPYFESFALVVLFSYVSDRKKLGKPLILGVFIGGLMIMIAVVYSLIVLGAEYASTKVYVPYLLGAEINIANVIQRIEVIIASIWIVSTFIKSSILLLVTVLTLQQLTGSKDYRFFPLPIALLSIPLSSLVMPSLSYWEAFENVWPFYGGIFAVVLPLIIVGVQMIKTRVAARTE